MAQKGGAVVGVAMSCVVIRSLVLFGILLKPVVAD